MPCLIIGPDWFGTVVWMLCDSERVRVVQDYDLQLIPMDEDEAAVYEIMVR